MTALAMTDYVFPPIPTTSVPIVGSAQRFPVRRVFCVGRNYAAHAREMGADPSREPPFFFSKPTDGIVPVAVADITEVRYPPLTRDLHHEIEFVIAIGRAGADIAQDDALAHVWGYALGLDLTRREVQSQLKEKSHPWELGKAFDQSAPLSAITPVSACGHPTNGEITLDVNGDRRQTGQLDHMIWSPPEIIAHLSRHIALAAGDLIFTGTPAGVASTVRGDLLSGAFDGLAPLRVRMV
jgi:fumarylpyruvate hydrolase